MFETIMMTFKLTWQNRRVHWLHFTRQYKDTLQRRSRILMSFCSEFIWIYVYRLLLQYTRIWRSYCKN